MYLNHSTSKIKITLIATILIAAYIFCSCNQNKLGYFTRDGLTQGSTYHIVFEINKNCINPESSEIYSYLEICDSIELYLKNIDFAVSGYNKSSILSLFNSYPDSLYQILYSHNIIEVETESNNQIKSKLAIEEYSNVTEGNCEKRGDERDWNEQYEIFISNYKLANYAYTQTKGKVDCSAAPLFDLWGFGFKKGVDVTQSQIDSVKEFIGMGSFITMYNNEKNEKIEKKDPRSSLNFNAIAQGFTADYIGEKFSQMGIDNFLIEIGGEILVKGKNRQNKNWRVGIDKPEDGNNAQGENIQEIIEIAKGGLVTSGDYRKFYIKDGKKFSHTIDPEAGYPVEHNLLSATIMAPSSAISDIYATYCMVIGLERAKEFIEREKNITGAILLFSSIGDTSSENKNEESDKILSWKYKID